MHAFSSWNVLATAPLLSPRQCGLCLLSGSFLQDCVEQAEVSLQYLGLHQHWLLGVRTRGDQWNAGVFIFLTKAVKIRPCQGCSGGLFVIYLNCFLQLCVWAAILADKLEKLQDLTLSCQCLSSLPEYLIPNTFWLRDRAYLSSRGRNHKHQTFDIYQSPSCNSPENRDIHPRTKMTALNYYNLFSVIWRPPPSPRLDLKGWTSQALEIFFWQFFKSLAENVKCM